MTEKLSNEDIAQMATSRARHDVKLLDGGAVFVIDSEDVAPRLELTVDQVKNASPEIKTTEKERLIELWNKLLTNNPEIPEWSEKFNFRPEAEHLRVPLMQLFELFLADPNAIAAVRLKDQSHNIGYEHFILLGADKETVFHQSGMKPNDSDFARQVVASIELTLDRVRQELGKPSGERSSSGEVFKKGVTLGDGRMFSFMDLHYKIGMASEAFRTADFCFTLLTSRAHGWPEYQKIMSEILGDQFLQQLGRTKEEIFSFIFTTLAEVLGAHAGLSKKIRFFHPYIYDNISSVPKKN